MRAFTFVFALAASQLLSLVPVDAKLPRKALRTSASTDPDTNAALATRQHHEPRALLDVCAYIDTDSLLGGLLLGIPLHELLGLKLCLCLSALPLDLEANAKLRLLGEKYGSSAVNAALALLVRPEAPPNRRIHLTCFSRLIPATSRTTVTTPSTPLLSARLEIPAASRATLRTRSATANAFVSLPT